MYIFFNNILFTKLLNLLKSVGADVNLSISNFSNLSISSLSTSDFKLAKSSFIANCDVSKLVAFF